MKQCNTAPVILFLEVLDGATEFPPTQAGRALGRRRTLYT